MHDSSPPRSERDPITTSSNPSETELESSPDGFLSKSPPVGGHEDRELRELPRSPQRARAVTLASLVLTALASLALSFALLPDASYALGGGVPRNVGSLDGFHPGERDENEWIRAGGIVREDAVRFERPLEADSYRLARVEGNEDVWVQLRVPAGGAEEHFIAPSSFVGRLIPVDDAGLRYVAVAGIVRSQTGASGGWLLIDGEAPSTMRWILGLVVLLAAFAGFCGYGLFRLTRPVGANSY